MVYTLSKRLNISMTTFPCEQVLIYGYYFLLNYSICSTVNESKYVWMSNLPQGVKAVDIKDRCTPFGRVS